MRNKNAKINSQIKPIGNENTDLNSFTSYPLGNQNDVMTNVPLIPLGSNRWTGSQGYINTYGGLYTPSDQPPPFPCEKDNNCTLQQPKCREHGGLFVKILQPNNNVNSSNDEQQTYTTIEIPFGKWECFGWYAERIEEATGIPTANQRLIYAGMDIPPGKLHGGLQRGSTIHLVIRKED